MSPFFIIITPTYKRPQELQRAIDSLRIQKYENYIHIIINDSPDYDYSILETELSQDKKVIYLKNENNVGKNASLNNTLDYIHENTLTGYIIFLDDDDWLNDDALKSIADVLKNTTTKWLVTERVLTGLTKNIEEKHILTRYNYFFDYLLSKKLVGDKTHIISTEFLSLKKIPSFSRRVKNGEEWFFFCQLPSYFLYSPLPSTLTHGYTADGLNEGMQKTYKQNTFLLFKEEQNVKTFLYLCIRLVFGILKRHD